MSCIEVNDEQLKKNTLSRGSAKTRKTTDYSVKSLAIYYAICWPPIVKTSIKTKQWYVKHKK